MFLESLVLCLAALPLALHAQGTSDDNPLPAPAPDEPITTTYTTATAAASRPSSTLDGPAITTYVTATAAPPKSSSTPDEPVITTYVTATGPPPASATAAPTQTVCSLGVKICESPRVELSCRPNMHCNACVWYNRRFRSCKWWMGDDEAAVYDGKLIGKGKRSVSIFVYPS